MDCELALGTAAPHLTPVAVRDDAAMIRNLTRMAATAAAAGVRLRPHAKTHKSSEVARRQLAGGAAGLTVATLQEAEVFAAAGVTDIVIAHPPVGSEKQRRLAALAGPGIRLAVSIDAADLGPAIPAPIEILWEVDSGLRRVGTLPGAQTVAAVRSLLENLAPARFRGLLTHGGHSYRATGAEMLAQAAREEATSLTETAALLRAEGIEVRELSTGATPTAGFAGDQQGITEIRPGTYIYGDAGQVALGSHLLEDCALAVVATVVSTPTTGRAVLDCGSKSISADRLVPALEGFGLILGRPDLRIERLSEEHAVVTARELGGPTALRIGQRVAIVPAHVCTTVNLHPALLCFDAERGNAYWEPVNARGWRPA